MSESLTAFHTGLFEEGLEEASFLHAQCSLMRKDAERPWTDVEPFERRLERHLDLLVVGGELALRVCNRRAAEGDPGELFAALCVFCRQQQPALVAKSLSRSDLSDQLVAEAVACALKYELPATWSAFIEQALSRDGNLAPVLAVTCAYRRIDCGTALTLAMRNASAPSLELVVALGRLRVTAAQNDLLALLSHPSADLKSAALLALLEMGVRAPLQSLYLVVQQQAWPQMGFALGGDKSARELLTAPVDSPRNTPQSLLALGLLGLPSSLRHLFDCLDVPALAPAASMAMNWIAGADLYEDQYIPSPVDEVELFPREARAWQQYREAPRAADGRPFGETKTRLTDSKDAWKNWFVANLPRFDPHKRYRRGAPICARQLVRNILVPRADPLLRKYSALELSIRYGCDLAFEIDMPIPAQLVALRGLESWAVENDPRFVPGGWYFRGRPL